MANPNPTLTEQRQAIEDAAYLIGPQPRTPNPPSRPITIKHLVPALYAAANTLRASEPISEADYQHQAALNALCLAIDTPEEAKALLALLPGLRDGLTVSYLAGLKDGGHG